MNDIPEQLRFWHKQPTIDSRLRADALLLEAADENEKLREALNVCIGRLLSISHLLSPGLNDDLIAYLRTIGARDAEQEA